MDRPDTFRRKIAEALGEPESSQPIQPIRIGNDFVSVSLGAGNKRRAFLFEKVDGEWEYSREIKD